MKLKEAFALAKAITEERADSESIDKYISMFNKGIEVINTALKNGKCIEHNDNNLTLALDNISKEITKEYFGHANRKPDSQPQWENAPRRPLCRKIHPRLFLLPTGV